MKRLGPYEIVSELGRGGMGAVYRARHVETGAEHAVKVILEGGFGSDAEELARFGREAELLARIEGHPGIVRVHGAGLEGRTRYIAMELVAGRDLDALAGGQPLPPEEAARVIAEVADAIAHIHRHGVLHRDLKPENVIIDASGRARVLDFGLALDGAATRITETGTSVGTPAFMAPEQVAPGAGDHLGPATDVYALGAVLYVLLTGQRPFAGDSPQDVLYQILETEPIPPARVRPEVPAALASVCQRAMAKRIDERYPSADELAGDLRRWQRGDPVLAARAASLVPRPRLPRAPAARAAMIAAALLVACLVASALVTVVVGWRAGSPADRLAAIERALRRGAAAPDEAADEAAARLASLAGALEAADDPALARRFEQLRALLAALEAPAVPDPRVAELARLLRPDGAVDSAALGHARAVLHQAGRLDALDFVLHGVEPVAPCGVDEAADLARAMIAPGSRILPPPPGPALEALYRAPLADEEKGRLLVRSGERFLETADGRAPTAGDLAAAFAVYLRAFRSHGTVGRTWPDALHAHGIAELARLVREEGASPATRSVGDLLCGAPGQPLLPGEQAVSLQALAPGAIGFDHEISTPGNAELRVLVIAVLSRHGLIPFTSNFGRDVLADLGVERVAAIGAAEVARTSGPPNLGRILVVCEVLAFAPEMQLGEPDAVRAHQLPLVEAVEAAAARGGEAEQAWLHLQIGLWWRRLGRVESARRHLERALELDRLRPDAARWPRIAAELVAILVGKFPEEEGAIARATDLIDEAARVQVAVAPRLRDLLARGGAPSIELAGWAPLLARIARLVELHTEAGTCCGPDEPVRRLLDLALRRVERGGAIDAIIQLGCEQDWFTIGEVYAARAGHRERHGDLEGALADLDTAVAECLAIDPLLPRSRRRRLEEEIALRGRRRAIFSSLERADEAAEEAARVERARRALDALEPSATPRDAPR